MSVSGIVNLFKPCGATSARYVYRLRRHLGERRVGHAGTLDPFADGVLIACVGKATRLVERLMGLPKVYEVSLRLGLTNDSFDPELPTRMLENARPPTNESVQSALAAMTGDIEQIPPAYSAIKLEGSSAHRLARRGNVVSLPARRVRIDSIELLEYSYPRMRLRVTCGRGTYIRALARDLGERWSCGAICEMLTRTRVGPFGVEASVNLFTSAPEAICAAVVDVDTANQLLAT